MNLHQQTSSFTSVPLLTAWIFSDFLLNHVDHDLITHEPTCVHDLFRSFSQRGLLCNLSTQHIPGRKMTDTKLVLDRLRLCAFS